MTPVGDDLVGVAVLSDRARRSTSCSRRSRCWPRGWPGASRTAVRGAGPLRQRSRRRVAGRVLLVGDAAGYVDALTGEGIALGLAQARAAVGAGRGRATRRATSGPGAGWGGATTCSPRACSPRPGTPRCAAGSCRRPLRLPARVRSRGRPAGEAGVSGDRDPRAGRAARRGRPRRRHHAQGAACTTPTTPLHLAFSCYLFDGHGRLLRHPAGAAQADLAGRLDQQRAAATRPPASRSADAVRRRVREELASRRGRPAAAAGVPLPGGDGQRRRSRTRCARSSSPPPTTCRRPTPTRSPTSPGPTGRRSGPACSTAAARSARGAATRSPACRQTRWRPRPGPDAELPPAARAQ